MAPASTASSAPASAVVDVAAHPLAAEQQQQQEDPLSAAAAASDADGGRTTPTPRSVSGTAGVAKSTASVAARSPDSEAADAASPQLTRGGAEGASPAIGSSTHHGWLPLQGPNESSDTLNGSAASPQQRSWSGSARKIGYPYGQKNEEEQEAEAVEQNLERWAAEERQRRRAARSSRVASGSFGAANGTAAASPASSLARRLSSLGRKASGAGGAPSLSAPAASHSNGLLRRVSNSESFSSTESSGRESDDSRRGGTGALGDASNGRSVHSGRALDPAIIEEPSEGDAADQAATAARRAKGKQRARDDPEWSRPLSAAEQRRAAADQYAASVAQDPFRDDLSNGSQERLHARSASGSSAATLSAYGQSGKATPRHPIVTPGRAPTIKHRARQSGRDAPEIVATDMDARPDASNPFADNNAGPPDASDRYAMRKGAKYGRRRPGMRTRTIEEGEEGAEEEAGESDETVDEGSIGRPAPARKSTSSSRFNEVGLDDESDGWPAHGEQARRELGQRHPADEELTRKPWWTDWLCGCGNAHEREDEQTGKTGPDLT